MDTIKKVLWYIEAGARISFMALGTFLILLVLFPFILMDELF